MPSRDSVWKALADPTRRAILDVLAAGPRTTGELCEHFAMASQQGSGTAGGIGRTGVMKHLDVLQDANLILVRRQGRTRHNHLNPTPIQQVADRWIRQHVRGVTASLTRLQQLAEHTAAEPAPTGRARPLDRQRIVGRGVRLDRVDPARDAERLFAIAHGSKEREAIWEFMGYGPFVDEAAMTTWLAECAAADDPLFFTVRRRPGGDPVGMASFLAIAPAHRRVEIGHIWYGLEAHRTTINTEVAYLLLEAAFDRGYRRVEWKCDARNQASRRAAERLGFAFEGLFRAHLIVKQKNRDTAWFAMLDSQWPTARAALEEWLAWDGPARPPLASLRHGWDATD